MTQPASRAASLYTPVGIAAGTLLGSMAAGAALLWLNYRSLGNPGLANKVGGIGLLLYLVIVIVASMLPGGTLIGVGFLVLQTALAYWAAEALQGDAVRYHLAQGGHAHPAARAALMGLLTGLTAVLVLLIVTQLLGVGLAPA